MRDLSARKCLLTLFLTTVAAASGQITQVKPMPPRVEVKVDSDGNLGTVPARVFGTFLEPIDYSINNGVLAEILVNGSLEAGLWNQAMLEELFRDQPELIDSSNSTGIAIPWQPLNPLAGNRYELMSKMLRTVGNCLRLWEQRIS